MVTKIKSVKQSNKSTPSTKETIKIDAIKVNKVRKDKVKEAIAKDDMAQAVKLESDKVAETPLSTAFITDDFGIGLDNLQDDETVKGDYSQAPVPIDGSQPFDLGINYDQLQKELLHQRKKSAIRSARENPIFALYGALSWPFWRLSSAGRGYYRVERAKKLFTKK
jgi:hypothetical protein